MPIHSYSVENRFIRYAKIDTTADPESASCPSSSKQLDLARLLESELNALGISGVELDENGYVYARIPSNSNNQQVPTICFCSHIDTAPDCSGTNVKPIVHRKYTGEPIVLPDDATQVITSDNHPYLIEKIGDDLITASGLTLLGADDKAGIAIIMNLAEILTNNPEIPHGPIEILFTPDEEIGRGVDKLNLDKVQAHFGYTLDGGRLGEVEDETFSADAVDITIQGISAHPGYAKGKMVNAMKVAAHFLENLPKNKLSPESTEHREGFVHPVSMEGNLESAKITFIIRDHETKKLHDYEKFLEEALKKSIEFFPGSTYTFKVAEQYRNMKEVLREVPFVTDYAVQAMTKAGIEPRRSIIRGGTDGSRLSFMAFPCPNIFTGEMAIHSRQEYVSIQDMEKAVNTLVELVQIWEQHTVA
jgi:tripeptide aminopeptidase